MKNLININTTPTYSEKEDLLQLEFELFGVSLLETETFMALKKGFFRSYLNGISYYNIPYKVRGLPENISLFTGNIYPRVYPFVLLMFKSMKFECELHPILRTLKNIDLDKYFKELDIVNLHLSENFAESSEFDNFTTNGFNNYWIVLVGGLYLDVCDFARGN
jgi:hypothetical protein